jgi:PAS domain S-box-containing protein
MERSDRDIASVLEVLGSPGEAFSERLAVGQQVIDVLPIPVFFKGRDGVYRGVNRAWERFFGVTRGEMIGAQAHDLYRHAPWVAEHHRAMDEELWKHPGEQSYEILLTMPDGRDVHALYHKATYAGADGQVSGLIGAIIDITDRKRAEQREVIEHAIARFLGSAESLPDALRGILQVMCERLGWACASQWYLDERDHKLHCIAGWSVDDEAIRAFLESSSRETFVPGPKGLIREVQSTGQSRWIDDVTQRPDFIRAGLAAQAGLRAAFALPVMLGDEVLGAVEFFGQRVRQPDPWLLNTSMAVGSQIGQLMARRQAERATREAHDELAEKARELTRSNQELQQFAYVASHDLQEPLRMVSSYTQLLERRYGERLDGDAKEFMAFIVDGAARMKQLIEDLLEYSRVGTRAREFKPVASNLALAKALVNLRGAQEASGAVVTQGEMPEVVADSAQLTQLFQNLIGNAMKFRGAETPRIHVEGEERPDVWLFKVKDNGIGLDTQFAERIFMMFQRLHGKTEYPGTGIGLAICKKIVERHGGRIWVESTPGNGCTFGFTLVRDHGEQQP